MKIAKLFLLTGFVFQIGKSMIKNDVENILINKNFEITFLSSHSKLLCNDIIGLNVIIKISSELGIPF
jgi:hypothetical protein